MRKRLDSIAQGLRQCSPAMLASATVFFTGALIAIVMLIVRPSIVGDAGLNNASQVILILASWLVAGFVVRDFSTSQKIARWIPNLCAGLLTIALMSWSANVPIALAVGMPILLATVGCAVFEFMGWQVVPGLSGNEIACEPGVVSASTASSDISVGKGIADPTIENTELVSEDFEGEGSDLWESVQREFGSDTSLTQNVARWTNKDGEQTLVANVRCRVQPGSRSATIQLPVWPFLPGAPEVFCRVIEGSASEVKVTQVRPNGIAAEVTWANKNTSEVPESAVIEIVAMASANESLSGAAA